ncbi:hypothetical protein [Miltoncostaea oceani]|uniref:hypothetical protein n=1 Tax=Miltoncostaea oceani TaxID=2843216 RepID=UPI001C3CDED9|nr:hypothetical protein [Miltoncostaea oceani]
MAIRVTPPQDLIVVAESSAGFYPGRFSEYTSIRGARITNGHLAAVEQDGNLALMFATREEGPLFAIANEDLRRADKVKSGLNTVVEVVAKDGETVCFVGPRGRMRKIFAGVGHPLM